MLNLLLVGSGGFIGSALRYLVGLGAQRLAHPDDFPYGILAVNVLGCLVIGLLGGLADHKGLLPPSLRLFLFTGILGGFTTFSAFGYDTFTFGRDVGLLFAMANIALHIGFGIGAVAFGFWLARWC